MLLNLPYLPSQKSNTLAGIEQCLAVDGLPLEWITLNPLGHSPAEQFHAVGPPWEVNTVSVPFWSELNQADFDGIRVDLGDKHNGSSLVISKLAQFSLHSGDETLTRFALTA